MNVHSTEKESRERRPWRTVTSLVFIWLFKSKEEQVVGSWMSLNGGSQVPGVTLRVVLVWL